MTEQRWTIGDRHFATLRRAATNVLVGDHKHASSHVALHFLTDRVQDPLLYIITNMLTTLRRLFAYYPRLAAQIVTTVRMFSGKVRGPASALAASLAKVGWELTANAAILGPGGLRLNIPSASTKQIRTQLRTAGDWRKGVPDQPFSSITTIRLLRQLTDPREVP